MLALWICLHNTHTPRLHGNIPVYPHIYINIYYICYQFPCNYHTSTHTYSTVFLLFLSQGSRHRIIRSGTGLFSPSCRNPPTFLTRLGLKVVRVKGHTQGPNSGDLEMAGFEPRPLRSVTQSFLLYSKCCLLQPRIYLNSMEKKKITKGLPTDDLLCSFWPFQFWSTNQ